MIREKSTLEKLNLIYSKLQDEESKELFNIKLRYLLDGNTMDLFEAHGTMYHDWRSPELCEKWKAIGKREIVVFGSGYNATITKRLLSWWGYKISCFCDVDLNGTDERSCDGVPVISVDSATRQFKEALFILGSVVHREEMCRTLLEKGILQEQILWPERKYLYALRGKQYFDLFEADEDEVYLDVGTLDGETVKDFYQWTSGNYKRIYAFEPIPEYVELINELVKKETLRNVTVLPYAAWDKREELHFVANWGASQCDDNGDVVVQAVDIDSQMRDEKVTLIKMDIEGSELNALHGAQNTIRRCCPRLAISIYHKPEDFVDIGVFLLELVPEYKFYMRQYASNKHEMILYATL